LVLTGEGLKILAHPLLLFEHLREQTAAVEGLDGGHVEGARLDGLVDLGQALEHEDARAAEPQLAGQHQADRASPGHDHVDVGACIVAIPERC
jgi:hypothetical protein